MKKIIAFLIIVSIFLGNITIISADTINYDQIINNSISDYISRFFANENDAYYIGSNIPIYDLKFSNESRFYYQLRNNYYFVPFYSNNNLIGVAVGDDDGLNIGTKYVTQIADFIESNEPFVIYCYNNASYIRNSSSVQEIGNLNNLSMSYDENFELIAQQLLINEGKNVVKHEIYLNSIANRSGYYFNMPIKSQYDSNTCWAACIASMVQYYQGQNITCYQAFREVFPTGSTVMQSATQVAYHLVYSFGINAARSSSISMPIIRTRLSNNVAYIGCWTYPGYTGHMTIICGWEYTSNGFYEYMLMDPDTSSYTYAIAYDNSSIPLYEIVDDHEFTLNEIISYEGLAK